MKIHIVTEEEAAESARIITDSIRGFLEHYEVIRTSRNNLTETVKTAGALLRVGKIAEAQRLLDLVSNQFADEDAALK